jgi:hypothetical protein
VRTPNSHLRGFHCEPANAPASGPLGADTLRYQDQPAIKAQVDAILADCQNEEFNAITARTKIAAILGNEFEGSRAESILATLLAQDEAAEAAAVQAAEKQAAKHMVQRARSPAPPKRVAPPKSAGGGKVRVRQRATDDRLRWLKITLWFIRAVQEGGKKRRKVVEVDSDQSDDAEIEILDGPAPKVRINWAQKLMPRLTHL